VKPRIFSATINHKKRQPVSFEGTWKIPKEKDPGPGSYQVDEAIRMAQWPKVKGPAKKSYSPPCYFDKPKEVRTRPLKDPLGPAPVP